MQHLFKRSALAITKILKDLKYVLREKRVVKRNDIALREKHLDECANK